MKKLIGLFICMVFMLTAGGAYAFDISYTDSENDIIKVTAASTPGDTVSLLVINDGYTEEDIMTDAKAQQYFYAEISQGEGFLHEFKLLSMTDSKQKLKFVVNAGGKVSSFYWDYYPHSLKLSVIEKLNSTPDSEISAVITEAMQVFGIDAHPLYGAVSPSALTKAVICAKSDIGAFSADTSKTLAELEKALITAAYNDAKTDLLVENGLLMYADLIGFDAELYKDYASMLSKDGIENVNSEITDEEYKLCADISKKFEELVLYNLIMNNEKSGYGHVDDIMEKYEDLYSGYGFDTDKKAASAVYSSLIKSNASNLSELKEKYNSLLTGSDSAKSSEGGGGGASSGAYSSLLPGDGYIPADSKAPSEASEIFADLGEAQWAKASILKLYEKKIVNGKAAGVFAPGDSVTRAEFAKMITGSVIPGKTASNIFADMENHWAVSYVAAAYESGLVKGVSETKFAPDDNITREQGAAIIYRALAFSGYAFSGKEVSFSDKADISAYAAEAVEALYSESIINGMPDGSFKPKNTMTRAEATVMLCRMLDKISKEGN